MCPERTAEGSALKEIHFLPQVIGAIIFLQKIN